MHDLDAALAVGSQQGLSLGLPADGADELSALGGVASACGGEQPLCDGLGQRSVVHKHLRAWSRYPVKQLCSSAGPRITQHLHALLTLRI